MVFAMALPSGQMPEFHPTIMSLPVMAIVLVPWILIILIKTLPKGPTIKGVPGSFFDLFCCGAGTKYHFVFGKSAHYFHSLHQSYGNIARFAPGQATTNTLKGLRNIYGAGTGKGSAFLKTSFYKGISRRNIFTASDPVYHATVRKLFGPSMTPGAMQAHGNVILECTQRLHGVINATLEKTRTISLNRLLYCHSVDTVSEVLLGKSLGCLKRGKPYFWTEQLSRIFFWATIREQFAGSGVPTLIKLMLRYLIRKGVRSRAEQARMRLINEQLIAPHNRRDIMVEVMERANTSELDVPEIAENFSAIMLAGFHTTQNALCATIYFVLTHPEANARLVAELQAAFASPDDVSGHVAEGLPYLNAVITESLRLYPPVPLGGPRVSPGAYVDGTYIPAGTEICTSLFALHHNPEYFNEPYEFIPERWTEPGSTDKKEAVQPFLVGSRSCVAKYFAKQMMQLTLASFFMEYEAEYVGPVKDWQRESRCYAFWEVPDLKLKLQRRQY
ncbi:benzoate 4-monooxygenase cytochrome P450 [Aspergillus heteromorphus CBS 117.55]|uniref:Benzoate 4-monooxygenase cytochrome P450 n=1 Tax=Aspergillus heteromorphus CBS 117.55 TaxID=1448321 RepID=A0A317WLL3_9EURO|nr:benzoate 4-monooxygenase cytochrome P450 [Aspergillus heteromorphus CBS 117.55]PWY85908.1 benzoate 4-monooxygenase cytochrome P450 [Aspergillus heteromorphus CBS 117.55]